MFSQLEKSKGNIIAALIQAKCIQKTSFVSFPFVHAPQTGISDTHLNATLYRDHFIKVQVKQTDTRTNNNFQAEIFY